MEALKDDLKELENNQREKLMQIEEQQARIAQDETVLEQQCEKLKKLAYNFVQTQEAQEENSNEFKKINKTIESIKSSQEAEQDRVNEQLQHQKVEIAKTIGKLKDVEVSGAKIDESVIDLSTTVESLATKQKSEAEKIMQQQKEGKKISQKLEECYETQKQAIEQITIQSSKIDKSLETQRQE